jgi:inosose dehydratase
MTVVLANAPVSFGAFEMSRPDYARPDPEMLMAEVAAIGYRGIDLGDPGYLGSGPELAERLARHGLGLTGGWCDLPFYDDDAYAAALPQLQRTLDLFDAAGRLPGLPDAKPTLAVSGRPVRTANPGGGARIPGIGLDSDGWKCLARNVNDALRRCADRGWTATFHHHACTDVESPAEVDRLLADTDIDLTLDTGHLIVGGGDPVEAVSRWAGRINHLHLKDARSAVIAAALESGAGMIEVWSQRVFVPIGDGDLDVAGVVGALQRSGYSGWAVVEQDIIAGPADSFADMLADQRRNYPALVALGFGDGDGAAAPSGGDGDRGSGHAGDGTTRGTGSGEN